MFISHNHAKPYCRTKIIINFLEESFKMSRFVREISHFDYELKSLLGLSSLFYFMQCAEVFQNCHQSQTCDCPDDRSRNLEIQNFHRIA